MGREDMPCEKTSAENTLEKVSDQVTQEEPINVV